MPTGCNILNVFYIFMFILFSFKYLTMRQYWMDFCHGALCHKINKKAVATIVSSAAFRTNSEDVLGPVSFTYHIRLSRFYPEVLPKTSSPGGSHQNWLNCCKKNLLYQIDFDFALNINYSYKDNCWNQHPLKSISNWNIAENLSNFSDKSFILLMLMISFGQPLSVFGGFEFWWKIEKMSNQLYRKINFKGQMLFQTQNAGIVQH